MKLKSVTRTPAGRKEFQAVFEKEGKEYIRRFGTGSNYVLNKSKTDADRDAYRARHRAGSSGKKLSDPMSPAALSMYILWGESRTLSRNVAAYRRKFNLG